MSTITIQTEMARCLERMSTLTPGSEEYRQTLNCLADLHALYQRENWNGTITSVCCGCDPGEAGTPGLPDAVPEPCDTPDPAKTETGGAPEPAEADPAPESETPRYEKAQVREALANARLKGLNVANLIHEVGANILSGVDPSRYGELMDNLARALEGMG